MIRIDKVITRGGDGGLTSLGDGSRVSKIDARVEALGDIDELNAQVGVVRANAGKLDAQDRILSEIQQSLFDLGADLSVPANDEKAEGLRITRTQIARLEAEVERLKMEQLPLSSFVLPGGTLPACCAHVARTVARRAERRTIALLGEVILARHPCSVIYLNRLSDYFFVLSRYYNDHGRADVLWRNDAAPTNDHC